MSNEIKQVGERLKGLREALDISPADFAESCSISLQEYLSYENGERDITISTLKNIAAQYNIDSSVLMFGDEPRMNSYFLTRKGKGQAIERVKAYHYQTLGGGFNNPMADIYEVTVEPTTSDELHLSSHVGQEFNLVLEGSMMLQINGKELMLTEGDSIYFDSALPHGMRAMDNKRVKFLTVVL